VLEDPGGVCVKVAMHEQADEIRDGRYLHCETRVGRAAVWVLMVAVYSAQNSRPTDGVAINWRRQLSRLHFKGLVVVVAIREVEEILLELTGVRYE
jgi:hypothetical protein